jgi:hypothetical protein
MSIEDNKLEELDSLVKEELDSLVKKQELNHLKEGITLAKQNGNLWECFGCKKWGDDMGNYSMNSKLYDRCYDCVDLNYICVDCENNEEFGKFFPYDHKGDEWICKPCIGRYELK